LPPGPSSPETHVLLAGKIFQSVAPDVRIRTASHKLATRPDFEKKGNPVLIRIPFEYCGDAEGGLEPPFTLFAPDKSSSLPYGVRTGIIRE